MPIQQRDLTISSPPSAAAPATPAGFACGNTKRGFLGRRTTELPASELVAVIVVPVVDIDVPDINEVLVEAYGFIARLCRAVH